MKLISADRLTAFVGTEPDKKMSRRQLASLVPCHPSFIDHLTSGRKTSCEPKTAQRIAEVLGVPLEILFDPNVPISSTSSAKRSSVKPAASTHATRQATAVRSSSPSTSARPRREMAGAR